MSKYMWDKEEMKKRVCEFIDKCADIDISFDVSEAATIISADGKVFASKVRFSVAGSFDT